MTVSSEEFSADPLGKLTTERRNPRSVGIDLLDATGIARLMNDEDATIAPIVAEQAEKIGKLVEAIVERMKQGGRLIYAGAGTSGRLGVVDAAECPPTFHAPHGQVVGIIAGGPGALLKAVEGAEDSPEWGARDLIHLGIDHRDSFIAIAASGRTPYCIGALAEAKKAGAITGAVVCVKNSEMSRYAQHTIEVETGPEILTGSTRLRAGTATKLVLNTISTAVMIGLGKTHGDLLVDLRASNEKLRQRAIRIVSQSTNSSIEDAKNQLMKLGGEVKPAIVASLLQIGPEEARERLRFSGGRIVDAFGSQRTNHEPVDHRKVWVGIDGGGTSLKMRFGVCNPDRTTFETGTLAGPPVLPSSHGLDGVIFEWKRRILGFLSDQGIATRAVKAIVAGTSGAGTPEICRTLQEMLVAEFPGSKTEVMADVRLITLAGGDPQAICLIAGTGSICWWEPFPGVVHRAGGWGPFVGDEGGGIWVVDQALRAICGAEDGREGPTKLKEEFLRHLGFRQVRELLPWREQSPRKQVAALSKIVLETANSGDPASKEICARGAGHLVNLVRSVLARELQKIELSWPKVFAAGGMFSNRDYFTLIAEGIKATCPRIQITQVDEPVVGAFHHAQKWTNELPTS